MRVCKSSTWLCVSRSRVAAPSWAWATMRAASSWAWRRICALCWPSDAVSVASSTTGWAARSSASARAVRSSSSRASSVSRVRETDWRYDRTSSLSKPRRTTAKEWWAMSPVAILDDEMGARPSAMARAYGAAWTGTGLVGT